MGVLLDSSALLALLWKEKGANNVAASISHASISSVNASEVIAKMVDRGIEDEIAKDVLLTLGINIVSFDTHVSILAGQLRRTTKSLGLSLGNRACIAQGILSNNKILTADRAWKSVDLGVEIEIIR